MTLPLPTEEQEQIRVVEYLELRRCKFTAIPNSTYTKSIQVKVRNTRMGLRRGFPDLAIIANGTFFTIEMKRRRGVRGGFNSDTPPEQKSWHKALNEAGVPTFVCYGADEAIAVIDKVLLRKQ